MDDHCIYHYIITPLTTPECCELHDRLLAGADSRQDGSRCTGKKAEAAEVALLKVGFEQHQ